MENIGRQILEERNRKGYSQNELADLTGLNIRTIQRIEKGETQPRGHSLRKLFEVLDLEPEQVLDFGKKENTGLIQVLHLSTMAGLLVPLGNIIAPLIIWLANKNKVFQLDNQAKNLIFWQGILIGIPTLLLIISALARLTHVDLGLIREANLTGYILTYIFITAIYPLIVVGLIFKLGVRNFYPRVFKR